MPGFQISFSRMGVVKPYCGHVMCSPVTFSKKLLCEAFEELIKEDIELYKMLMSGKPVCLKTIDCCLKKRGANFSRSQLKLYMELHNYRYK